MASVAKCTVDARKYMAEHVTVKVTIQHLREAKIRLWIASRLILLAGWILGAEIRIVECEE